MIMIIGGAYQGKLTFAKKMYPDITWADGAICEEAELYSCEGIYHFHQYIERSGNTGSRPEEYARSSPHIRRKYTA